LIFFFKMITTLPKLKKSIDRWQVVFYVDYKIKRKYVCDVSITEKQAQLLAIDVYAMIFRDYHNTPFVIPEPIQEKNKLISDLELTLSEHIRELRNNSAKTITQKIRMFVKWLNENNYENLATVDFKPSILEQFRIFRIKSCKVNTVKNEIGMIKIIINKMINKDLLQFDVKKVVCKTTESTFKKIYTKEEVTNLFDVAPAVRRLVYSLVHYAFIRVTEILRLTWEDVNLENGIISIDAMKSKNKRNGFVKINNELRKEIERFKEFPESTHHDLKSLICSTYKDKHETSIFHDFYIDRKKAKLNEDLTLYALKHTGVVFEYLIDKDIKKIQIKCRHANISETDKYLNSIRQLFMID